jgi:hypothetical protein
MGILQQFDRARYPLSFGRIAGTKKDKANKSMIAIRPIVVITPHKTAIPHPIAKASLIVLNTADDPLYEGHVFFMTQQCTATGIRNNPVPSTLHISNPVPSTLDIDIPPTSDSAFR